MANEMNHSIENQSSHLMSNNIHISTRDNQHNQKNSTLHDSMSQRKNSWTCFSVSSYQEFVYVTEREQFRLSSRNYFSSKTEHTSDPDLSHLNIEEKKSENKPEFEAQESFARIFLHTELEIRHKILSFFNMDELLELMYTCNSLFFLTLNYLTFWNQNHVSPALIRHFNEPFNGRVIFTEHYSRNLLDVLFRASIPILTLSVVLKLFVFWSNKKRMLIKYWKMRRQ